MRSEFRSIDPREARIILVEAVDEIPKSPSGKILRRVLVERERAAAGGAHA